MWRRQLLILLLALALPLQGYAAASMLWCGPVHPSPVVQSQGEHQAHSGHEHSAGAGSNEAHAAHHSIDVPADASGAQPQTDTDTDSAKCSLCAACSVGLALLPTVPMLGVTPSPESVLLQPSRLSAAFLTGGIERPPRAVLA